MFNFRKEASIFCLILQFSYSDSKIHFYLYNGSAQNQQNTKLEHYLLKMDDKTGKLYFSAKK